MDKNIHFGCFCSAWGPILWLAWTSEVHCCKIWLWPATVCSIFTAIDANYTYFYTLIPVLQQLQLWIDTFIQLLLWKLSKVFFLVNWWRIFQRFLLRWPCPSTWPRIPLWYVVWIGAKYLLTKGRAGSWGEHTQKLTTRHLTNHLIQEANSFLKINWACAVTLNLFIGFDKYVFGRQL